MRLGIFKYPYVSGDAGAPFPHFPAGIEDDRLWVRFGEYALSLLYPRPITSVWKDDRAPQGIIADVGQEWCRSCGYVALAKEFRTEDQCPKCGSGSWLAQYGVNAE